MWGVPCPPEERDPLVTPAQSAQDRIAAQLRAAIRSGEYPDGRLPTERELCERYGVARNTVRGALDALIREALIVSRRGHGYLIRTYRPLDWRPGTFEHQATRRDTADAGADAWAADVAARGLEPHQEVEVSIVDPPPRFAADLHTPPGERVVVRRRQRFVDGELFQLADSYYPLWVAEGTPIMQPGDVTIPGGLMAAAGQPQARYEDAIESRMATHLEIVTMSLDPVTPMIVHTRVGFNVEDVPVRVIETRAPGDRLRILLEFVDPGVTV